MKRSANPQAEFPSLVNVTASAGDEIDLVLLWLILWKRKFMVIALTLVVTVSVGVVVMLLPKIYKITAIIELAKDAEGKPVELPEAIRENILGGAYDQQIIKENHLGIADYPKWQVQVPKGTKLLKISLESARPKQGVSILTQLLTLVSMKIEDRLLIEKQRIGNDVELAKIKYKGLLGNIKLLTIQTRETTVKIDELESARKQALSLRASDAMSVLLYSNEIQTRQIYLNNLQLQLKNAEQDVASAVIAVDNARLKLSQIQSTVINKPPTLPEKSVKPKKVLITGLAGIFGLMVGVMLVFFLEFVSNAQQRAVENR